MSGKQNIVEVGFNTSEFNQEKEEIYNGFLKVYGIMKEMSGNSMNVGGSGWTELKQKAAAQESQINSLQQANVKLTQSILDNVAATQKSTTATTADTKAKGDDNKAEQALEKTRQSRLKTDQEVMKTMNLEEKQTQLEMKTKRDKLQLEAAIDQQRQKGLSAQAAEAKIAEQLTNEYYQMNQALRDAELRYKNLALVEGIESDAAKQSLAQALSIRDVLDKVDVNLRNHQRNVGNYKSSWDGLGNSFNQVARELPSLTISAQQFFLAISNNLPMVFDQLKIAKQEIAALKAEGQAAPSIGSRIVSSIFSWNTAITVGITLLTAFSDKIIDAARDFFGFGETAEQTKKRLEGFKQAMQSLNEVLAKSDFDFRNTQTATVENLKNQLVIMEALGKSNGDLLEMKRKIADQEYKNNDIVHKTAGDLTEWNRELVEALTNTNNLTDEFDKYVVSNKNIAGSDEFKNNVEAYKEKIQAQKDQYNSLYNTIKDYYSKKNALDSADADIVKYNADQKLSREIEGEKLRGQAIINSNQRILNDEHNFESKRIDALRGAAAARKNIIDQDLRTTTSNPAYTNKDGTHTAEYDNATKKAAADRLETDKQLAVDIYNVQEEFRKRRLTAELEITKAQLELSANYYRQISTMEDKSFGDRTEAYANYYRDQQELIKKEYEFQVATKIMTDQELLALQAQTNKKMKELAIAAKKEISDIFVSSDKEQLNLANALNKELLSEEELKLYKSLKNKAEFEDKAKKLRRAEQRGEIQDAIYQNDEILKSSKTSAEAKKKAADENRAYQTQLNQLELQDLQDQEAKKQAIREIYYQLEQQGIEAIFNLMTKLSDNYTAKRLADIDKERQALEANYSEELTRINGSTVAEQEKAAMITRLNAQKAASEEQLARKEREEKVKNAKLDKEINIARIVIETALAVVHELSTGDPYTAIARAIAVGALGAAELAVAIATPIPSYGEGVKDKATDGPGLVGEKRVNGRYQKELVEMPGQKAFVVDRPTIFGNLPAGTNITPLTGQINDALYGSMVANMAERQAIVEAAEARRDETAWKIAKWQTREITNGLKSSQRRTIRNHITIDMGFNQYIDQNIFGK